MTQWPRPTGFSRVGRIRDIRRLHPSPLPFLLLAAIFLAGGCAHEPVAPVAAPGGHPVAERAAAHAERMVGRPYRYGGAGPSGFDCSGLVKYSYARAGLDLPHGTHQLWRLSRPVSLRQLRRGDLLFFDQEGRKASHVGIYLGDGRFVHAPSTGRQVYISELADPYWHRHFSSARRLNGLY